MTNVWMLLVGGVATVAICYQNVRFALAYGWALVHGAGPAALLAFLPLAVALALLWAGYLFLRKRTFRRKPLIFAAHACAIVLLNELLLPGTPRQAAEAQETVLGVKVGNIRDELVLSAAGNPIGVRLTFEVVVPQTGSYAVLPGPLQPERGAHSALQLGRIIRETVEPEPFNGELREKVRYRFSKVFLPNFLSYDERTGQPCFDWSVMGNVREEVLVATVSRAVAARFRTAFWVGRGEAADSLAAAEYMTEGSYDLGAFYQTIVTEGNRRCGS